MNKIKKKKNTTAGGSGSVVELALISSFSLRQFYNTLRIGHKSSLSINTSRACLPRRRKNIQSACSQLKTRVGEGIKERDVWPGWNRECSGTGKGLTGPHGVSKGEQSEREIKKGGEGWDGSGERDAGNKRTASQNDKIPCCCVGVCRVSLLCTSSSTCRANVMGR